MSRQLASSCARNGSRAATCGTAGRARRRPGRSNSRPPGDIGFVLRTPAGLPCPHPREANARHVIPMQLDGWRVPPVWIEQTTYRLQGDCSTAELRGPRAFDLSVRSSVRKGSAGAVSSWRMSRTRPRRNLFRDALALLPSARARCRRKTFCTGATKASTTGKPAMSDRMTPLIPACFAWKLSVERAASYTNAWDSIGWQGRLRQIFRRTLGPDLDG